MRNLLGRLLERTPAELERIAQFWAVELRGHDRHSDVSALYRTMTDVWTARDAWQRLSADDRALLQVMLERPGLARTSSELASASERPPEHTRDQLRRLYAAGIVAVEDDVPPGALDPRGAASEPELFLPREVALLLARISEEQAVGATVDEPLEQLLARVSYPELEEAALAWGARVIPAMHARGDLVAIVREQLTRPERVERYVANLSGPARNAWARLKKADGRLPLDELVSVGDVAPATRRRILRELATPLLLWHGYANDAGSAPQRLALIPTSVLTPAPRENTALPELRTLEDDEVIEPEWNFPFAAAWDLLTVLREVVSSHPRWRALTEGDAVLARRVGRRLWRADHETRELPTGYLAFLARVGGSLGVLREDDERASVGEPGSAWREQAFATAQQRMVAAWTASEEWIEGRARADASLYGAAWPAIRAGLLRALGELEEERWHDETRFIERVLAEQPELLRQAQVGALPGRRGAPSFAQARAPDRRAELLTLVLGTTLETAGVWLGLIERSRALADNRPVLRVTPFGRWLAGRRIEPALPALGQTTLAVGANFQILLYRPTPRRVWALSAFAEITTLDRVSTYTLTAEALIRALSSNLDLEQIVTFLERANNAPLPQNVAFTLAEWDRGYRRVWLRRAVVLQPDAEEPSEPIAAALKDAGLEPETLPDGRLLLLFDDADAGERLHAAAQRALRERGFAPLSEPHHQPRAQPVRPVHSTASQSDRKRR